MEQKKLTIQIVSQSPILAQALFDFIKTNKTLLEFSQLKFNTLPKTPEKIKPQQFPSLKLRRSRENITDIYQYYELSEKEQLIGRDPKSFIPINSKHYRGVSWNHAIIKAVLGEGNLVQWEIWDLKSTNGTFINGKRIKKCQRLQLKDKITLGSSKPSRAIAELIFDFHNDPSEPNSDYWEIIDCDLLLLAIDTRQNLSTQEQEFIKNIDSTSISRQFLVADLPDPQTEEINVKNAEANLAQLENWLKNEATNSSFELVPLFLKPYYDRNQNKEIESCFQKKQEHFFKSLDNLIKGQPENLLANRLTVKLIQILEPVEPILERHQKALSEKIDREKQKLEELTNIELKGAVKQAINQINEDKDKFFKQVKLELAQAKGGLLDNYSKYSIIYKIQELVESLKLKILIKNGQKYIRLSDEANIESQDINKILIVFCTSYLKEWIKEEWKKICEVYNNGGLNALLQRAYAAVDLIPSLLQESPFASPQSINMHNIFLISFAGISCELPHKQISLGSYIMKQLRSQMMQIMMMLTLGLSLIGVSANKNQLMKDLSSIFNQQPWIFGLVVSVVTVLLVNSYRKENDNKIEEVEQKLKKDVANYYQSFTKNLLEKIIQDLNLALEVEDNKINNSLKLVSDMYNNYILELEKQQTEIKKNLEEYKNQQRNLEKDLSEFNKLKRL
ncbi:FHA domain-containing protein [Pleurocapsales cyanobacterium LEGE 06147]|nr:FHA domain-containing protein [Pleurocapsales cyanobacterium LEGE 06147]